MDKLYLYEAREGYELPEHPQDHLDDLQIRFVAVKDNAEEIAKFLYHYTRNNETDHENFVIVSLYAEGFAISRADAVADDYPDDWFEGEGEEERRQIRAFTSVDTSPPDIHLDNEHGMPGW